MNQDVRPLRIYEGFVFKLTIMNYFYTLPLDDSGLLIDLKIKLLIGSRFEYWGFTWEVEGAYNDNDFYCKKI
jgi:hypothetical protein